MAHKIENLLDFMIDNSGADMILTVGFPPAIRVSQGIRQMSQIPLKGEDTAALMKSITPDRNQKELNDVGTSDFGFAYAGKGNFRVSVLRQQGQIAIVLRLIPNKIFTFDELGLPPMLMEQVLRPRGLFLVTGPTGSGKTTTLASLIHHVNVTAAKHIITVEDPIEFRHTHAKSIITQREVGPDVPSFKEALRRALRQDPDVILVGEMRDLETTSMALTAAETGHLVMATLHTNSASSTITRIIDQFPPDQQETVRTQLASALNIVLCQTLLEKIGGGRIPAYEIMKVNSGMRNMIRENKIEQLPSSIQTSGNDGNILLDDYLFNIYIRRKITEVSMMERSADPKNLALKVRAWKEEQAKLAKKKSGA